MTIILNGDIFDTSATSVAALLDALDLASAVVATALNGELIPREERQLTLLQEGDRVEVLAPMQGG